MQIMPNLDSRQISRFEQHFGAITQAVIVALLVWTGSSLINLREQVAVLKVQVDALQAVVQQAAANSYTNADAIKDFASVNKRMDDLDRRLNKLESK